MNQTEYHCATSLASHSCTVNHFLNNTSKFFYKTKTLKGLMLVKPLQVFGASMASAIISKE